DSYSRIRKGGSYVSDVDALKGVYRTSTSSDAEYPTTGFRCAKTVN
ncbi:MAG: hypothetical protein HOO96_43620, partial [Polyangiaceae bacterium]|nr:hypothetical protein [Polyangiaceae bacterium]